MLTGVNPQCHYYPDSPRTQPLQAPDSHQPTPVNYYAGLLRLWREGAGCPWRASLQDAESGERLGFADLEQLFAYLQCLTGDMPDESSSIIMPKR
jgi:hypothetical protein